MKKLFTALCLTGMVLGLNAKNFTFEPAGEKGLTIARVTQKGETWILREGMEGNYIDYVPLNLPEEMQQEGIDVVFEGVLGKIPANVRMMGKPLQLSSIKRLYIASDTATDAMDPQSKKTKAPQDSVVRMEEMEGVIRSTEGRWFIYVKEKDIERAYLPDNLPDDFKVENLSVVVTGMARISRNDGSRRLRITDMIAYEEKKFDADAVQQPMKDLYPFEPVGAIDQKAGIIKKYSEDPPLFVFETDNGTTRYLPAILPASFQQHNLPVIITGFYGNIPNNVRLVGIPLEITTIEVVE